MLRRNSTKSFIINRPITGVSTAAAAASSLLLSEGKYGLELEAADDLCEERGDRGDIMPDTSKAENMKSSVNCTNQVSKNSKTAILIYEETWYNKDNQNRTFKCNKDYENR